MRDKSMWWHDPALADVTAQSIQFSVASMGRRNEYCGLAQWVLWVGAVGPMLVELGFSFSFAGSTCPKWVSLSCRMSCSGLLHIAVTSLNCEVGIWLFDWQRLLVPRQRRRTNAACAVPTRCTHWTGNSSPRAPDEHTEPWWSCLCRHYQ